MSTEIDDAKIAYGPHRIYDDAGRAVFLAQRNYGDIQVTASMNRADFLAAVQSELHVRLVAKDAIVIERGDLPEVTDGSVADPDGGEFPATVEDTPENLRAWGRAYFALAEHLAAHPRVDEAQVRALASLITEATDSGPDLADVGNPHQYDAGIARRLIATGRIEVTP
ncbi:MAG TPA: hypothetical protein VMV41_16515 [Cellulomonadaceae bacterium]|nr:hypothetical protein [Cellulomonadaceae bacterium]